MVHIKSDNIIFNHIYLQNEEYFSEKLKGVYSPIDSNLKKVEKLIREFEESKGDFKFDKKKFHPENCYTYEAAAFRNKYDK